MLYIVTVTNKDGGTVAHGMEGSETLDDLARFAQAANKSGYRFVEVRVVPDGTPWGDYQFPEVATEQQGMGE